jgi:hypothetical protein
MTLLTEDLTKCIDSGHRKLLLKTVKLVAASMQRTVEKQLVDFLSGGKLDKIPSKENLNRASFAHLTNLGCEHHFGDLDSSQRRRPDNIDAMHHHSSVQLLKRNRVKMMEWLEDMPSSEKDILLKRARKGGKELREKTQGGRPECVK